jgi:Icc-related predicted phosphoesterase
MRILAFSDWRVQSIDMINEIIQKFEPDAILYAGDDLDRVIPNEQELYLKTENRFIKVNNDIISNKKLFILNNKLNITFEDFLIKSKIKECNIDFNKAPFYYVNGNDDIILENDGSYYLKLRNVSYYKGKEYSIVDTPDQKLTIREVTPKRSRVFKSDLSGFYRRLSFPPTFGIHQILNKYSIYGSDCTWGRRSKILNCPDQYADIYLTHLPPLGCLDFSTRFGIRHVGSNYLRQAIKKHNPKYVI